jgi:hypothetical protein
MGSGPRPFEKSVSAVPRRMAPKVLLEPSTTLKSRRATSGSRRCSRRHGQVGIVGVGANLTRCLRGLGRPLDLGVSFRIDLNTRAADPISFRPGRDGPL